MNEDVLERYVASFRKLSVQLNVDSQPDLNVLIGLPGVAGESRKECVLPEEFAAEIEAALESCLAQLNSSREREGEG